jgi:hypothetical protein
MLSAKLRFSVALVLALLLAGCAAHVPVRSANLLPLTALAPDLEFDASWPIRLSTGYTRDVPARSQWRAAGMLPQGTVYRPLNTVFAIEGRQVHEAWLVVQAGALQGFYLPAENNFSPLSPPLSLPKGATR